MYANKIQKLQNFFSAVGGGTGRHFEDQGTHRLKGKEVGEFIVLLIRCFRLFSGRRSKKLAQI